MASSNRRPSTDIIEQLHQSPRRFSAVQVLRLLRHQLRDANLPCERSRQIYVKPELSLESSPGDVREFHHTTDDNGDDHFELVVSFLGLYGASSPLPIYYTEELLAEARNDSSMLRDFFDLLQQPLYQLFYDVWSHSHWAIKIHEEDDLLYENRLLALMGFGLESLRHNRDEVVPLLRYLGLFAQAPRSAVALRTLLRDALQLPDLNIQSYRVRWSPLATEQQCHLGIHSCTLGEESYLGNCFQEADSGVTIDLGILDLPTWQRMAPGQEGEKTLKRLCQLHQTLDLDTHRQARVIDRDLTTTCLGLGLNRLGVESWLYSGEPPEMGLEVCCIG